MTTKTEQNNGIPMFNTSNEGTGGFGISYSSRKMRGKVLNFINIPSPIKTMCSIYKFSIININNKSP
jgi:hypothetical protein